VVVQADGEVGEIRVVKSIPGDYTQRAIEAAHRMKFKPATKNGKPVSQTTKVEFDFDRR
jgi:TonB family protein